MSNIEKFIAVYEAKLTECVATMPDQYYYEVDGVPRVVAKMKPAFVNDTYNISNAPAIKKTCKELGIPFTRKAIKAFINSDI